MNIAKLINDWTERLGQTTTGFAVLTGISRATVNAWRADRRKDYTAVPRPQTLLKMAASLELYADEVRVIAGEMRKTASNV